MEGHAFEMHDFMVPCALQKKEMRFKGHENDG